MKNCVSFTQTGGKMQMMTLRVREAEPEERRHTPRRVTGHLLS